jgi:hypothetical protein
MRPAKVLFAAAAVVLAVVLLMIVWSTVLMLSIGGGLGGQRYTPESLLDLLVLVAAAVSVGLLLWSAIRRARHL